MGQTARLLVTTVAALGALLASGAAAAAVGTTFPSGFHAPIDASLGVPVIGFGAAGPVERTPVVLLHGNNDTPYPTACNPFYGDVQDLATFLLAHGYRESELWALGYQGDQCDLVAAPTNRSGRAHSTIANVPDLRAFVNEVLRFTGAKQVDIIAHSLGGTLAREWMRQDNAYRLVRRLVMIASPNHGIVNCSPNPLNYWQAPALGGFTPDSAICLEYGAADTPFLLRLNHGLEARPPTRYLSIFNRDSDFVYVSAPDGVFAPVPAEDRNGRPYDFSFSPRLHGAAEVTLSGQGRYDLVLGTAHLGILASPETGALARAFLGERAGPEHGHGGGED